MLVQRPAMRIRTKSFERTRLAGDRSLTPLRDALPLFS
jgi:hypothetical protein